MSLSAAAAAMGLPEALVQRSAEARAAETGQSVDDILAAWAGGEAAPTPEAPAAEPEPAQPEPEPSTEQSAPPTPVIETPQPTEAGRLVVSGTTPTRKPVPAEVTAAEAAHLPEVITVPTAGIRERTNFVIPKWLTALMLFVPLLALFALGGSSTGACGEATELSTDVISGEIVNCDGTQFTGGGAGGGGTDFIALGEQIYSGAAVTGVNCSGCHGPNGQGGGAFPALTGVLTTFGSCSDHELWVTIGSSGWASEVGPSYGDTNKPVGGGGMPAFGGSLSEEQLASVVAFERVRFGGEPEEEALVDCGLVEPADGADGEAPAEDGGATATTVPADTGASG